MRKKNSADDTTNFSYKLQTSTEVSMVTTPIYHIFNLPER